MNHHLTSEQLNDLLLSPGSLLPNSQLDRHLRLCSDCASELATLRASLANFRAAATVFAHHQAALPAAPAAPRTLLSFRTPLAWAAAAVIVVAAVLPASLHRARRSPSPAPVVHSQQSDEALLEEIDRDLSAPIPSAMQPLNDPTGSLQNNNATQRTSK